MRDAIHQAGTAEELARRIEPLVERRYNSKTITAWARGVDRVNGPVLLAIAQAMGMSLDSYLKAAPGEESVRDAIARIDDTLSELIRGLGLEDAIPSVRGPATAAIPDLRELIDQIRDLQDRQDQQGERGEAPEVG